MGTVIGLALMIFYTVGADRRGRHWMFGVNDGMTTEFYLGTPPQKMSAQFDTTTAELMVMDAACVDPQREAECPAFCRDDLIQSLFCSPLCVEFSPAELLVRCPTYDFYVSNRSVTFVRIPTAVDREWRFRNRRPLTARPAREQFSFVTRRAWKVEGPLTFRTMLETSGFPFLRGFRYDYSDLLGHSALLGVASRSLDGQLSIIPWLKAAGTLDRAIMTVHMVEDPIFRTAFVQTGFGMAITVGAQNMFHCIDWRRFPAYSQTDWDFEISSVRFAGKRFDGKIIVELRERYMIVPKPVVDEFVDAGILTVGAKNFLQFRNASDFTALEFWVGPHRVTFSRRALKQGSRLRMKAGEAFRYTDETHWAFGHEFIGYFCYGFDYDRGNVLWGQGRYIALNQAYY